MDGLRPRRRAAIDRNAVARVRLARVAAGILGTPRSRAVLHARDALPRRGRGACVRGDRGRLSARAAAIGLVAALGLSADGWIGAMPLGAPPRPFGVATVANGRVLELPMTDDNVNVAAMYRGMLHGCRSSTATPDTCRPRGRIDWALRRRDPTILTELRRGHHLYVVVAGGSEAPAWTAFMDAQHDMSMLGVTGAGGCIAAAVGISAPDHRRPGTDAGEDGWER